MPNKGKRVLVVGSARVEPNDTDDNVRQEVIEGIAAAGRDLGGVLAQRGYCILVGSDFEKDVDPYVVEGALAGNPQCQIEVHVPLGGPIAYPGQENVKTIPHQFPDWDVTVMDTIEVVDGIVAIGGRAGVIQAGLSGWKMGKPVVPIATFGGGGQTMWEYGSATRQKFYRNALSDLEIDQLTGPWTGDSAAHVVGSLEKVARRAAFSTSSMPILLGTVIITLVAAIAWIWTLMIPYMESFPPMPPAANELADATTEQKAAVVAASLARLRWFIIGFFSSIGLAGLLGAAMQTLRRVRDGRRIEPFRSVIDIVLGVAAGLVTAMLFLIAQIVVQGEVVFDWSTQDYSRIVLLSSMASLFASLYLDSALSRFDTVKESVMAGTFED